VSSVVWWRWGDAASSTRTTLRASARSGGGRVLVLAVPSSLLPRTHPQTTLRAAARRRGGRRRVVPSSGVLVVLSSPSFPSVPLCPPRATPTREPPYEQMLVGVGRASWPSSSPPRFVSHTSTLRADARSSGGGSDPPSPVISHPSRLPSPSSVHAPSTSRAAAREAGGAWGVARVVRPRSLLSSSARSVVCRWHGRVLSS
jgi:hypothetical protein